MNLYSLNLPIYHTSSKGGYVTSIPVYVRTRDIEMFLDNIMGSGPSPAFEDVLDQKVRQFEREVEEKIGAMQGSFDNMFEYSFPLGESRELCTKDIEADYIDPEVYEVSDSEDESYVQKEPGSFTTILSE